MVAAGVHDDNNKRCSLPSGSNIILSLFLSTAALRLSSWFAHSSSPFLRLFFSCSHLASARARARPAVPLISRFVCAFKHGFPSSGVSRGGAQLEEDAGETPYYRERNIAVKTKRRERNKSSGREKSHGDLRRKVSFAITNELSLCPCPPLCAFSSFTDHVPSAFLTPMFPLSSRSSLRDRSFFLPSFVTLYCRIVHRRRAAAFEYLPPRG